VNEARASRAKSVCYEKEGIGRAEVIGGTAMPVDRMVEKARKLLASRKVERLDIGVFNVVGDHGTYIVVESYDGKISCNCPRALSVVSL
jgi:hypothetical protein